MVNKVLKALKDPEYALRYLIYSGDFKNLSDEKYLKIMFKYRLRYKLNLENPRTFNEKLQWLKIRDRNPLYHFSVRNFIWIRKTYF